MVLWNTIGDPLQASRANPHRLGLRPRPSLVQNLQNTDCVLIHTLLFKLVEGTPRPRTNFSVYGLWGKSISFQVVRFIYLTLPLFFTPSPPPPPTVIEKGYHETNCFRSQVQRPDTILLNPFLVKSLDGKQCTKFNSNPFSRNRGEWVSEWYF